MAKDPFKELKEAPYDVFIAPKPYSYDLNEDMIKLIREEFSAEGIASKFADAAKGKTPGEAGRIGKEIFEDYGEKWMKRTMQLGDEYSDRTIEVVKETVDRNGNQFLFFPYIPQRFIEIAYLSTQQFLKVPITLDNAYELAYRLPQCQLFNTIKEKCGDKIANLMTCQNACLRALETLRNDLELSVVITMVASTAKDGYCEFSMRKL
jgi:hypothetical protein